MKVGLYQPLGEQKSNFKIEFHKESPNLIIEIVYTFNDLISKVNAGHFEAIIAARPESYGEMLEYHELMHVAIASKTKVYEAYSSTELTTPFTNELQYRTSNGAIESIKRYIDRKNTKSML